MLLMIIIFVHSAMPADVSSQESSFLEGIVAKLFQLDADTASFVVRKCAHFLEYLALGMSMMFFADGLRRRGRDDAASDDTSDTYSGKYISLRRILLVFGCAVLYAVSDEVHQSFVPGRSCELRDMCIDAAGILVGIGVYLLILRIHRRRMIRAGSTMS